MLFRSPTDATSDLYSLASVLYEMVSGTPPFGSATGQDIATLSNRIQHEVPASLTSLGVPSDVDRALLSALAKEPAQRPNSASSLADALGGSGGIE